MYQNTSRSPNQKQNLAKQRIFELKQQIIHENNAVFQGTMKNYQKQGYGICIYDNGIVYIGNYQHNHFNGQGIIFYPEIGCLFAQFHQDQIKGYFIISDINGENLIIGKANFNRIQGKVFHYNKTMDCWNVYSGKVIQDLENLQDLEQEEIICNQVPEQISGDYQLLNIFNDFLKKDFGSLIMLQNQFNQQQQQKTQNDTMDNIDQYLINHIKMDQDKHYIGFVDNEQFNTPQGMGIFILNFNVIENGIYDQGNLMGISYFSSLERQVSQEISQRGDMEISQKFIKMMYHGFMNQMGKQGQWVLYNKSLDSYSVEYYLNNEICDQDTDNYEINMSTLQHSKQGQGFPFRIINSIKRQIHKSQRNFYAFQNQNLQQASNIVNKIYKGLLHLTFIDKLFFGEINQNILKQNDTKILQQQKSQRKLNKTPEKKQNLNQNYPYQQQLQNTQSTIKKGQRSISTGKFGNQVSQQKKAVQNQVIPDSFIEFKKYYQISCQLKKQDANLTNNYSQNKSFNKQEKLNINLEGMTDKNVILDGKNTNIKDFIKTKNNNITNINTQQQQQSSFKQQQKQYNAHTKLNKRAKSALNLNHQQIREQNPNKVNQTQQNVRFQDVSNLSGNQSYNMSQLNLINNINDKSIEYTQRTNLLSTGRDEWQFLNSERILSSNRLYTGNNNINSSSSKKYLNGNNGGSQQQLNQIQIQDLQQQRNNLQKSKIQSSSQEKLRKNKMNISQVLSQLTGGDQNKKQRNMQETVIFMEDESDISKNTAKNIEMSMAQEKSPQRIQSQSQLLEYSMDLRQFQEKNKELIDSINRSPLKNSISPHRKKKIFD